MLLGRIEMAAAWCLELWVVTVRVCLCSGQLRRQHLERFDPKYVGGLMI